MKNQLKEDQDKSQKGLEGLKQCKKLRNFLQEENNKFTVNGKEEFSNLKESVSSFKSEIVGPIERIQVETIKTNKAKMLNKKLD